WLRCVRSWFGYRRHRMGRLAISPSRGRVATACPLGSGPRPISADTPLMPRPPFSTERGTCVAVDQGTEHRLTKVLPRGCMLLTRASIMEVCRSSLRSPFTTLASTCESSANRRSSHCGSCPRSRGSATHSLRGITVWLTVHLPDRARPEETERRDPAVPCQGPAHLGRVPLHPRRHPRGAHRRCRRPPP